MQAIGFIGETGILLVGGPYPYPIECTLRRFILFDGLGLVFLLFAFLFVMKKKPPILSS